MIDSSQQLLPAAQPELKPIDRFGPTLCVIQSNSREITINGIPDVSFRVLNASSDEAAFERVREVLAVFNR